MSKKITQDELETYLWGSAVLLRNHIDAGAYKQYIFPLHLPMETGLRARISQMKGSG